MRTDKLKFQACRCSILFLILNCISLKAQFKDPGYSIAVEPTFGTRIAIYKGSFSDSYKDSLQKADRYRDAIGASFLVSFKTGKKQRIYTGLQFHNFGFTRKKENIRFMDTIHPQIGIMNDLSQTGGAHVDFNYRFMYLSLPVLFSRQISGKKMTATTIHLIWGGSVSVLLKHDIRAVLRGFSTRGGDKVHPLTNEAAEAQRINANLHAGFRLENLLFGKDTWIFAQPEIYLPAFTANGSSERYRLLAAGIQVGIYYQPVKDK